MTPPALPRLLRTLHKEWFLVGMIAAVLLASLAPNLGRSGGVLHGDRVADAGIALVFFLHGLGISLTAFRNGLARWKVHLVVQLCT